MPVSAETGFSFFDPRMYSGGLMMVGQVAVAIAIFIGIYLILEDYFDTPPKDSKRVPFLHKFRGNFDDQLIEALLMISSSLKAGRNLDQAFELVAASTPPPLCDEFRTFVQERRLGVAMVEALSNLARRVKSTDLRLAVNATIFQQETGGNIEDLYRQIVATVAERKKIMGKVRAGTAHARLSGNLVGAIPLLLGAFMFMFHRQYILLMMEHPMGRLVLIASIIAAILGLLFINRMTRNILPESEDMTVRLNDPREKAKSWGILRPLIHILGRVVEGFRGPRMERYRDNLRQILMAAGSPGDFSVDDFVAIKIISGFVFACLGIIFFQLRISWYGLIWMLLPVPLFIIGFHLPKIFLTQRIRARQTNIEYELPYIIDLLSLAIEAGLDLTGGIQRIVDKSRPTDMVVEFQTFLNDIKLGKSMEEALNEMAERVQILSFFTFVSSLIQAQRLGAEIGPTLRAQAEQMRYQRMILAEERVNQLPVKLLIPLVFFIFPSVFVLVMGPSITHLMKNLPHIGP
jgi:tight adherence protein C